MSLACLCNQVHFLFPLFRCKILSLLYIQDVTSTGGELSLLRDELSQRADAVRYQDLCAKSVEKEVKRMEMDSLQQQVSRPIFPV